jgi:peptide deformylase
VALVVVNPGQICTTFYGDGGIYTGHVPETLEELQDNERVTPTHGADDAEGEVLVEDELEPELAARRSAALAHVRKFGDPVLKSKARPVERFDQALRDEIARMGLLMSDALGIGLAATQVGVLHRVLVYRVAHGAQIAALVNPVVEWKGSEEEIAEEGCLSLPSVHVEVERPVHVRVRAQDERGEQILIEASGLEARVIQHELDHLDGVLILDRTTREQRKQAIKAMREALEN